MLFLIKNTITAQQTTYEKLYLKEKNAFFIMFLRDGQRLFLLYRYKDFNENVIVQF